MTKFKYVIQAILGLLLSLQTIAYAQTDMKLNASEKQGQYLITLAGCNDCHTPSYARRAGRIDLDNWLTGSDIGFKGPWGVTYASNLRNYFAAITEQQWLQSAKQLKTRPPMPWFVIRQMKDDDLRAIYSFIIRLGKKGDSVPKYTPRGQPAQTSFINFMPQPAPSPEGDENLQEE